MVRLAFVTGGASGLGAGACRALAQSGHCVAVVDINAAAAKKVAKSLPGKGHVAITCDITSEASVKRAMNAAEKIAPIAVIALFAGGTQNTQTYRPRIQDTSNADWDRMMDLNARSSFFFVREFLLRREKKPVKHGRIILVSSQAAQAAGSAGGAAYAAAKACVLGLMKAAARDAAPFGITVNAIAPGPFDTPAFHTTNSAAQTALMMKNVPLGRMGTPDEMGAVAAFLASEGAAFITGSTIDVNGGTRFN